MDPHAPDHGSRDGTPRHHGSRSPLAPEPLPLRGRAFLVTGVSRRAGIGYALACRLAAYGASVFCHHFSPHDREQPWGGDDIGAVVSGVRRHLVRGARVEHAHADLTAEAEPERLVGAAHAAFGRLDGLVCNQALSGFDGALGELTAAQLDSHWAVDARASILLAQEFARLHSEGDDAGIVFLTSGQGQGPMPGEIAYAAAKAAIAGLTVTLADQLADARIRVNTVNPGPVDTGYATEADKRRTAPMFPLGRWGEPDDPARLIAWLLTDDARWITGQVVSTEGGFARWRAPGQE